MWITEKIYESRYPLLRKAFARFEADEITGSFAGMKRTGWMITLPVPGAEGQPGGKPWMEWDDELRTRDAAAIREAKEELRRKSSFSGSFSTSSSSSGKS